MGESSVTATVRAIDDDMTEGTEKVAVTVRHGGEDIGDAEVRVLDNEGIGVSFGAAAYEATEGGSVAVTVLLSETPDREVVVPLTVSRGGGLAAGDYEGVPPSVTFGPEETETSFTVAAVDDGAQESEERLTLRFGQRPDRVDTGATASVVVTVLDDDGPPGPPVGLVATLGDRFVRLTWGAPSPAGDSPIDRYEVRRDRGAWRDAGALTEYTFSNLQNEREYAFEVRARRPPRPGSPRRRSPRCPRPCGI